jgi:PQQ-dependent catabolism-associated CXXCW motif protein
VKQDFVEAMRWYRKAADLGNGAAMGNIGVLYYNGQGVPQDYAEAMRWYRKGATAGNATSMLNVGLLYELGQGVPADLAEARRWFVKARDAGNQAARDEIAKLDATPPAPAPVPNTQAAGSIPAVLPLNYADELTDFGVFPQPFLQFNVGTRTPMRIPGGISISTPDLARMLNDARQRHMPMVLIDSWADNAHPTLPYAVRIPFAGQGGNFSDQVQLNLRDRLGQLTHNMSDVPIVFFCQGAICWESYNAALRAIHLGYRRVYWYRGGVNAWAQANLPLS